ncbi:TetR/AcrR family transcriptional regulator [uncultured Alistipes sp.]|jgi:AcrR family transcriptional regulator|uniref:TetR/AcrR family transcriptional regulator n=1 Tax=uncultured Alistipes sp. TaxID=538949 RepID=UPI0026652228|nr:TetR/AcrR family transcriptional regulator [uncultured Alistipes sp.]
MKTSREKILQSALQLFMSMNYERVSLEMVSRSVGLTKTGIFNYYPSKLDLFVDVADHFLFGLQDPARKFAPSDGTVIDFIEKYVDGVRRTMDEIVRLGNVRRELMPGKLANAGYFHLFQQVLFYYPDGRQRLHELMESEYELWCRAIRGGVERGELGSGTDIAQAAALFRQVFIGLSYQMSFSDGLDVELLRQRFLYIYGLLKR